MKKPTKVEVGQGWEYQYISGVSDEFTVIEFDDDNHVKTSDHSLENTNMMLDSKNYVFIAHATHKCNIYETLEEVLNE